MRTLADGHQIKCHLSDEVLETMESVISLSRSSSEAFRT
jgi:hypothetical protein